MTGAGIRTVLGVAVSVLVIAFCTWFAVVAIAEGEDYSFGQEAAADGGADAPVGDADWAAYPGTAWIDSEAVLGKPGEQELEAASDDLVADVRAAVSNEYDIVWTPAGTNPGSTVENGYGGESLLGYWRGERWTGELVDPDADARERIHEIIEEVGAEHGVDDFALSNDRDASSIDHANNYGSDDRDEQAYWQSMATGGLHPDYTLFAEVYDSSFPTGPGYFGWTPRQADGSSIEGAEPTLYVSLLPSAFGTLADGDRAEYEERLAHYAGLEKPEGEY